MRLFRRKPEPAVEEPVIEAAIPEPEPLPTGPYTGPRCWVPVNEYAPDGNGGYTLLYEGGWHYSTRINEDGNEVPDRKLHLNDSSPAESEWFYEYAEPGHKSWVEKHGVGQPVHLAPLPAGQAYPPEANSDHENHDWYRKFVLGVEQLGSKNP